MKRFWQKIKRLPGYVFAPIRANALFFVFMFLLGLVCTWTEIPNIRGFKLYEHQYIELFVDLYLVCLLLMAVPQRVRWWVRGAVATVLYAVAWIDVFCFVNFGSTITPTMLLLVGETNGREAGEFVSSYLSFDLLFSSVGLVFLLIALHVAASLLGHRLPSFLQKKMRPQAQNGEQPLTEEEQVPPLQRLKSAALSFLRNGNHTQTACGLLTLALLIYGIIAVAPNKAATARLMGYDRIGDVERELTRPDRAQLYMPIYRLAFSIHANRLTAQQLTRLIAAKDKAEVDSCSFTSPNIVLIIGESYNRRHSQLYGYDKETTPRQSKRAEMRQLTLFTDAVAPWNLTSFVFKFMFSLYAVGDEGEWCDRPLFPQLFRKAGYRVTFLTNQFLPKAREAVYDFSGGFFLNNQEMSHSMFDVRNEALHPLDNGLLADYDKMLKDNRFAFKRTGSDGKKADEHNLFIFHLMGQHVNYRTRYSKDRRRFKPEDYERPDLNKKQLNILSHYDNATLYNDSIVDQILCRFENENAIVIYLSDHGEECFDGVANTFSRLHSAEIDARLAREEFAVPMWIWCSHSYAVTHPDICQRIVDARNRPFMSDALPHLLLYLAGIHTKDYREQLNLLSPEYDETRPRVLKMTADYNQLKEQKPASHPQGKGKYIWQAK